MINVSRKTVLVFVCMCICFFNVCNYAVSQNNFPVPTTFGHTHFIVGMSADQVSQVQQDSCDQLTSDVPSSYNGFARNAYFSPDDSLEKKLIELIDHEQASMKVAIFQFTNGEIAKAFKRAQLRGVAIEVVTDPLCLQDKFNKITGLASEGLKIYIYNPDANISTLSNKMHHKFVVFGKNIDNKKLVWIGSFNFTKSADIANQESVVVLDDTNIIGQFNKQHDRLKNRSVAFSEFAKSHFIMPALQPTPTDIKNRSGKKTVVAHAKKISSHKRHHLTHSVVA